MRLLTVQQMRQAEETAAKQGLSYLRMMENAGSAAANWMMKGFPAETKGTTVFLCGAGNNGGDGFVAARRMAEQGRSVGVILACGHPTSPTAAQMLERLSGFSVPVVDAKTQNSFARQLIAESTLVVDGVFGIGFHGQLPVGVRELFRTVEQYRKPVIALDIPSGATADTGETAEDTPRCRGTVTFHGYKYAHVLHPAAGCCGRLYAADIGLPAASEPLPFLLDRSYVQPVLKRKEGDTHKGTFGKAALLVGSEGMSGAAVLSVKACLRCGVGLALPVVPRSIYPLVAAAAPEGVYRIYDKADTAGQTAALCMNTDACLAGCGLGNRAFAREVCRELTVSYPGTLILDADGINSLVPHIDAIRMREGKTVLTPHPGEMARLLHTDTAYVQSHRFETAQAFAREYTTVVVLKGAGTVVAAPDGRTAVNLTGNSGLSKGGSGDVLAGMIASLCAQGTEPFEAACAGVWLHGTAGDLAAEARSRRSMLPTDVVELLPSLFLQFEE